jgi:uncharacterized phage-associated protein
MYDVRAIANWFIERAKRDGKTLTAMQLQKLTYIAHGWSLAFDEPLVHETVEAWQWGPVFRSIYREFSEFGSEPITRLATAFDGTDLLNRDIHIEDYSEPPAERTDVFLESVWENYGQFTASQLMNMTHRKGTPWHQVLDENGGRLPRYAVIEDEQIKRYYKELLRERNETATESTVSS